MNRRSIQMVLFDVDGVLTDGSLYIGADGEVLKKFNARDGVAIALLKANGIQVGLFLEKRAKHSIFVLNNWVLTTLLPVVVISCLRLKCY